MPNCKQCSIQLESTADSRAFYDNLNVPEPPHCARCVWQLQSSFRNEKTFYSRTCDLCHKETLSTFPQDTAYTIYCFPCWNGDTWDAMDYGMEYDPDRPFFEQMNELFQKVPRPAVYHPGENIDCKYANYTANTSKIYLSFSIVDCENVYYSRNVDRSTDVIDCLNCENSELLYECIDCHDCYQGFYLQDCTGCTNSILCYDCIDCQNCFGCTNLRHKKYCWMNEQLTEEEYKKRMATWQESMPEARAFLQKSIRRHNQMINCENSTGDHLKNCKDCTNCFYLNDCENGISLWRAIDGIKDCALVSFMAGSNLIYNCAGAINCSDIKYSAYSVLNTNCEYTNYCRNATDCFGCSGVRNKKYCILNKQYSKEEYSALSQKIITQMKKEGTYGQFFPGRLSWFGYNETIAQEYFPLTKEQALQLGFKWCDTMPHPTGKETVTSIDIPKDIAAVPDSFIDEILACIDCGKNYRITPYELGFYKKQGLPLPKKCFDCRQRARVALSNPLQLWERTCNKEGCSNQFQTSFRPDGGETVYCTSCYKNEVY